MNSPILMVILGLALIWTGLNGTLGTVLSSIIAPQNVKFREGT